VLRQQQHVYNGADKQFAINDDDAMMELDQLPPLPPHRHHYQQKQQQVNDDDGVSADDWVYFRKPRWTGVISLSFSKYQTSLVFIIRSITLHKQLVRAIGRQLVGSVESLPGLVIGMTVARCHSRGKLPVVQII